MYIKVEVEDFYWLKENCWGGAIDTLNTIEEYEKEDELMDYLNVCFEDEAFYSLPSLTELNDFLWFDDESIFYELGINLDNDEEWDDINKEEDDWDEQLGDEE